MRFPRRRLWLPALAGGVALSRFSRAARAQPIDVPGEFQNVPMLPGVAGPYSSLAGVDPGLPVPAAWTVTAVPQLAALPMHIQAWEDAAVSYRPARAGFNLHAYGYAKKIGMVEHIPVCRTLAQLTAYFTGGQNVGLTTYGNGRDLFVTLDLTASDGSVWRVPFSEVHRYGPIGGNTWSPWAQGLVNRGGSCAVPPHPVAAYLGSGVPNGAFDSVENVAWTGADSMTDPQMNSNAMLRAASAHRNGYAITEETQVSHAGIDRVNRCGDPGWPPGLEDEARAIAIAILAGDLSRFRNAVKISSPPSVDWRQEGWQALVENQSRNDRAALILAVRQDYDRQREAAINSFDPTNWDEITRTLWSEMAQRARWDEVAAAQRRVDAETQLRRLT